MRGLPHLLTVERYKLMLKLADQGDVGAKDRIRRVGLEGEGLVLSTAAAEIAQAWLAGRYLAKGLKPSVMKRFAVWMGARKLVQGLTLQLHQWKKAKARATSSKCSVAVPSRWRNLPRLFMAGGFAGDAIWSKLKPSVKAAAQWCHSRASRDNCLSNARLRPTGWYSARCCGGSHCGRRLHPRCQQHHANPDDSRGANRKELRLAS